MVFNACTMEDQLLHVFDDFEDIIATDNITFSQLEKMPMYDLFGTTTTSNKVNYNEMY